MSNTQGLGPAPKRIGIKQAHVRELVSEQFPHWAHLPIRAVANGGWDNYTFHLGDEMSIRLPSAAEYALAVEKEHRWLTVLAPQLPKPIPVPLAKGVPNDNYPFSWSIYKWLNGKPASFDEITDSVKFAEALAAFIFSLQSIDTTDAPQPGKHNWFRGGSLNRFNDILQEALSGLAGYIDIELANEIWESALHAQWSGAQKWFHGDLAQGNILLKEGQLTAVIDFGTCGVGDPACDIAIAWTLLTAQGRQVFRDELKIEDDMWLRGRGWALWKTLTTFAHRPDGIDEDTLNAKRIVDEIFCEYEQSQCR